MRISFVAREQDALRPFVSDAEFFRTNPEADARVRHWRDEDYEINQGFAGSEYECFWISVAWRDGKLTYRQFPFCGDPDKKWRQYWYRKFEYELREWLLQITVQPDLR